MSDLALPPKLAEELGRTRRPVRRLSPPWRRAWPLLVAGVVLLVGVPASFGLREDVAALGGGLAWGASAAQLAVGLGLLVAALREAVPARQLSGRALAALGAAAVGVPLGITLLTVQASATLVPAGLEAHYWRVCFGMPLRLGLPVLLLAGALVVRAWPVRPVLTGALCGLGSGLLVDSGWRLFCEVADPRHVLAAHGLAALSLGVVGAVAGWAWSRWTERPVDAERPRPR